MLGKHRRVRESKSFKNVIRVALRENYGEIGKALVNLSCISDSEDFSLTNEVDEAAWFTFEEARQFIKENSLAKRFLIHYLDHQ